MVRSLLLAVTLVGAVPAVPAATASAPDLVEHRQASCASDDFEAQGHGTALAYVHRRFGLRGETRVGDAILEWCQSAQNAVIYFYVPPEGPERTRCLENMSFAIFPGEGRNVRDIVEANADSYLNPAVKLVEPPKTGPTSLTVQGRTIRAYQFEAVAERAKTPIRTRMIGYARGDDLIRVMTGYRDDPGCRHLTVEHFLAALKWP